MFDSMGRKISVKLQRQVSDTKKIYVEKHCAQQENSLEKLFDAAPGPAKVIHNDRNMDQENANIKIKSGENTLTAKKIFMNGNQEAYITMSKPTKTPTKKENSPQRMGGLDSFSREELPSFVTTQSRRVNKPPEGL